MHPPTRRALDALTAAASLLYLATAPAHRHALACSLDRQRELILAAEAAGQLQGRDLRRQLVAVAAPAARAAFDALGITERPTRHNHRRTTATSIPPLPGHTWTAAWAVRRAVQHPESVLREVALLQVPPTPVALQEAA